MITRADYYNLLHPTAKHAPLGANVPTSYSRAGPKCGNGTHVLAML